MIQQHETARLRNHPAALALTLLLTACGSPGPGRQIPRTLAGATRLGQFVPPYAYEAYVRGELALARGDAAAAVTSFELAAAAPEPDAYVLSRLAWAQALAGDPRGAGSSLEEAVRLDPCSEAVWTTRAGLAERGGDFKLARDHYATASGCAPRSARGPDGLARALLALGEGERAQHTLEAFALRTDTPAAFEASLRLALSRHDAVAAAAALEGLLASESPRADVLTTAIEAALDMGRPLLAARLAQHVRTSISPVLTTRVCLARGDVACAQGRLALSSTSSLGGPAEATELLLAAELHERAEIEASVALATLPSPRLYLGRARARAARGDTLGALDDLSRVDARADTAGLLSELCEHAGLPGLAAEVRARVQPAAADTAPQHPGAR